MHYIVLFCLSTVVGVAVASADTPPARDRVVGIVDYYAKYESTDPSRTQRNTDVVKSQFEFFKGVEPRIEWVDVDIFLPGSKAKRDTYQRIIIPYNTEWFTMPMYQGMLDYVCSGGLLISLTAGLLVDANGDYRQDDSQTSDFLQKSVLGVRATRGTNVTELRVVKPDSPLAVGLDSEDWLKLARISGGRCTLNINAVVVTVSRQECGTEAGQGPHLSYNVIDRGACIYISASIYNHRDALHVQLAKNVLSDATRQLLCAGD